MVFTALSKCIGGITICITPLLSLGADQFRKLLKRTSSENTISAIHLDEYNNEDLHEIKSFLTTYNGINSTLIIYASPQRLTRHSTGASILSLLQRRRLIRFIVVDEIHLYTHYAKTFRNEFALLKPKLLHKLYVYILI